ncbi:sodium/bile acid cotransporter 7-B/bile acid cotransporter 7-B [Kwoniella heveanensis BCC8398]|uniref:Sodium/bile acid cotransporter 7-B/bile acid cotransporter 7-B n=1 Tax=Kwoniella heveanensis BCC8398 TaxID=1296120 RepID=A0A1B9GKR8_9TREE|nr:sodium/bile acid cotransporter 7-B/bile acid cotransporter 7-B [Kwoniella heveanensis BCC8398]
MTNALTSPAPSGHAIGASAENRVELTEHNGEEGRSRTEALPGDDGSHRGSDDNTSRRRARWTRYPKSVLGWMVDNWFLIGIGVSIVLAWRFPHVASDGGVLRSEYSIKYGAIALIFLITGLTLSTSSLYRQFRNWRLHLFTQVFCFLFFPAIVFIIINIVNSAQGSTSDRGTIDKYVLAGMVVMSVMPTTVASNISMTRSAGGSVEATTMQVCIGNTIGTFITPLLCELFFSSSTWSFGKPIAKGGGSNSDGLKEIYRQLAKQLGLALFVPLFVGQVVQNIFPKQTKWVATTFRLAKVSTFLLLLLIWSVFSTQFQEKAFETVSTASIIFLVFVNLGLYAFFTLICVVLARLPFLPKSFDSPSLSDHSDVDVNVIDTAGTQKVPIWRKTVSGMRFDKKVTTAICFCAAAKGMVVGAPTLSVLYGGFPEQERAILSIPLVLYQGQQVAIAQVLVYFFKKWNEKPDRLAPPPKPSRNSLDKGKQVKRHSTASSQLPELHARGSEEGQVRTTA